MPLTADGAPATTICGTWHGPASSTVRSRRRWVGVSASSDRAHLSHCSRAHMCNAVCAFTTQMRRGTATAAAPSHQLSSEGAEIAGTGREWNGPSEHASRRSERHRGRRRLAGRRSACCLLLPQSSYWGSGPHLRDYGNCARHHGTGGGVTRAMCTGAAMRETSWGRRRALVKFRCAVVSPIVLLSVCFL